MLTFATKQTVVSGQLKGHQEPLRDGSADAAHPQMLGGKVQFSLWRTHDNEWCYVCVI